MPVKLAVPPNVAEVVAELGMTRAAAFFKTSTRIVRKWSGWTPIPMETRRTAPVGFGELYVTSSYAELKAHYRVSRNTLAYWIAQLDPAVLEARAAWIGAKLAEQMTRNRKTVVAARPAKEAKPARMKARIKSGGWQKVTTIEIPMDVSSRAIRYLQQYYVGVYRAEVRHGRSGLGLFRIGHMTSDATGLLAIAAKHGFEPDAWRAVA